MTTVPSATQKGLLVRLMARLSKKRMVRMSRKRSPLQRPGKAKAKAAAVERGIPVPERVAALATKAKGSVVIFEREDVVATRRLLQEGLQAATFDALAKEVGVDHLFQQRTSHKSIFPTESWSDYACLG